MRILWSSSAAQTVEKHLTQALGELESTQNYASTVYRELREANPDGGNRAINALTEQYDEVLAAMKLLSDALGADYQAVRQADSMFCDTEAELIRMAQSAADTSTQTPFAAGSWHSGRYGIMAETRNAIPVPGWLEQLLNDL